MDIAQQRYAYTHLSCGLRSSGASRLRQKRSLGQEQRHVVRRQPQASLSLLSKRPNVLHLLQAHVVGSLPRATSH